MISALKSTTFAFVLFWLSEWTLASENREDSEEKLLLFGNGKMECDERLPTLTVASDNILRSKSEWDDYLA